MAKLTDPEEFAIIRSIYFKGREQVEEVDQLERLDRMYSKKQINKR